MDYGTKRIKRYFFGIANFVKKSTCPNNFGLGHFYDRRMDRVLPLILNSGGGRQVGHLLERFDKFRSAIRVTGVIERTLRPFYGPRKSMLKFC